MTKTLTERVPVLMEPAERQAFRDAAELSGLTLSAWIRLRLREVCVRDLAAAGKTPAFLKKKGR
jgi:hypothetical protein